MNLTTQIPPLNSIRFVPENTDIPAQYHNVHFDQRWFIETIKYYQIYKPYFQKIEQQQRVTVQVSTQDNIVYIAGTNYPKLELLDQYGALVQNINATSYWYGIQRFPGNTYSGVSLVTSLWSFRPSQLSIPDGYYYLKVTNYDALDGTSTETISEPLWIKAAHKNTHLLEYSNDSSKDHWIVDNWPIYPKNSIRVEADIRKYVPLGQSVAYKDVNFDQHRLNNNAWRGFTFKVGGRQGVPAYMIDKLKDVFNADNLRIDGKAFEYINDNGGSGGNASLWNITDSEITPLVFGSIPIRYPNTVDSFTLQANKVALSTGTLTYPCALPPMRMSDGVSTVITPYAIFNNSGDLATYISATLNGTVASANDLSGVFTFSGGAFYYTNGTGENYSCYTVIVPFTTHPDLTVAITLATTPWGYNYAGGIHIVDWGDSTSEYKAAGSTSASHTYASTGNKTVRIFTDDNMTALQLNASAATAYVTNITGSVSAALQYFYAIYNDFSGLTTLNPNFLQRAAGSLVSVIMVSCGINDFSPAILTPSGTNFRHITYLDLAANNLSVSAVSNAIIQLYSGVATAGTVGYVRTKYQTPSAHPNGTALTDLAALAAAGWTYDID